MAKIVFNNKNYNIDESALASVMVALEAHLRSMAGGADPDTPTADFIAHLQTIAGEGLRVVVDGVAYNIDPNKVAGAVTDLEITFSSMSDSE